MKHEFNMKVSWGDTDAAGIVFFPNFYKWMNDALGDLFATIGSPISSLVRKDNIGIPIVESHCNHFVPAYFEDQLRIETTLEDIRNKVFKSVHHVYRGDTLLASGYTIRAWVDFSSDKPNAFPIPTEIRRKLEQFEIVE